MVPCREDGARREERLQDCLVALAALARGLRVEGVDEMGVGDVQGVGACADDGACVRRWMC